MSEYVLSSDMGITHLVSGEEMDQVVEEAYISSLADRISIGMMK